MSTTRERILSAGVDLMSTSGIAGITLGSLAGKTRMSKSGLFAHFGSKEDVQLGLLNQMAVTAQHVVVAPAMRAPKGLKRLRVLVQNWLGWSSKAGLSGGCPVAAGMFEYDDVESPVRDHLLTLERDWRRLLRDLTEKTIASGEFRLDLDAEQFVWELCGIYLSHHASRRFIRDPAADHYALKAFDRLIKDASPRQLQKVPQSVAPRSGGRPKIAASGRNRIR